jgi:hypothetical protein
VVSKPDAHSGVAAYALGLWCDDFDADLPKVVPGALDALGDTAEVELLTYCSPTNGKINCPAAWWTDGGLAAFFTTPGFGSIAPPGYVGGKEIVPCTFWEAVRDEWCHDSIILLNWRHAIWKPPTALMMQLMFDLRGWGEPLTGDQRDNVQENVRRSLVAAADRLRTALA